MNSKKLAEITGFSRSTISKVVNGYSDISEETRKKVLAAIEKYKYFPNKIFRSVIPRNVRLTEAPSHGKTILHYDPGSKGAKAYEKLARELIELI